VDRALAGGALLLALFVTAPAAAADPMNIVRLFVQGDGHGDRLDPLRWQNIAPLVAWPLEPAWDHLFLIRGVEVGTPQRKDGAVEVEVKYTVTAEIRSSGIAPVERVDVHTYRLDLDEDANWRIRAPALPPHVYDSKADGEALVALLSPDESPYVSNSAFVWRMLRSAGWLIAYATTEDLAISADYTTARTAEVGDLVLYFDGERPYHVGIAESEDTVVSATLNGGIRRTPYGAFAGEIRYRRPIAAVMETATPDPNATPTPKPKRKGKRR
jgi:hypothetical protein